ncbi:MAG TPA: DUF1631 family protein [Casimicrobiaceae bacterium]|nr:DUF1631 family protein [Casimicrobiaceae bacterium]
MQPPTASIEGGASAPTGAQAHTLLAECFEHYRAKLVDLARASIEMSGDLFEGNDFVEDKEIEAFRAGREAWLQRFDETLRELFTRRIGGTKRQGKRPDFDASLETLRVLTAFDQEKQASLVAASAFLGRITQRELAALDLRIDELLPRETRHDIDNPFGPAYILDAIGVASRRLFPPPQVWRAFMERVVADLTPGANKIYISLNRLLADRGVLPEIKAELRARSEHRPADDKDLIETFSRMLHDVGEGMPSDIVVPNLGEGASATICDLAVSGEKGSEAVAALMPSAVLPPDDANAAPVSGQALAEAMAELERLAAAAVARTDPDNAFPDLDPLMALGTSTQLFNSLGHLQRIDLPTELAKVLPQSDEAGTNAQALVPLNLIPHIGAAVSAKIANQGDRITMDVIALLFDYIFRDPAIPKSLRRLFGRLQVPVLKAALLDRAFFSDRTHAARQLLDHLAEAALGAAHDVAYHRALLRQASGVVQNVCANFEIDLDVFREADRAMVAFLDAERKSNRTSVESDVNAALETERAESHRAEVRAMLRDRLAYLHLPFEVRGFIETVWADYLSQVRRDSGTESTEWKAAQGTIDDLLWSIVAKERSAQKARLTKMIPTLIASLRKGCAAVRATVERTKAFFDTLYSLHVAAIKPKSRHDPQAAPVDAAPEARGTARGRPQLTRENVHDFVSEMALGTWLTFKNAKGEVVNACLTWLSPLRTKYIFRSRSRTESIVMTPEELAWEIIGGRAELVLEPVALFDRAVSAALDTLAAQSPKATASARTATAAI